MPQSWSTQQHSKKKKNKHKNKDNVSNNRADAQIYSCQSEELIEFLSLSAYIYKATTEFFEIVTTITVFEMPALQIKVKISENCLPSSEMKKNIENHFSVWLVENLVCKTLQMGGNINRHYGNFSDSDIVHAVDCSAIKTYKLLSLLKNS